MRYLLPLLLLGFLLCTCDRAQTGGTDDAVDFTALSDSAQHELANAPLSFELAPGLGLQTFAGEPMLTNPTNLDVDERGRAWVCTAQNYRRNNHDHPYKDGGDEILILTDTDGDGRADERKVFFKGPEVNAALGIAKLGEKVYVAASPNLLVFTDADGDDVPESMDTLFTGLDGVDHDHGVHAIVFGPDGKLYFNFGNEGKRLRLKNGQLAQTRHGETVEEGKSFRQGMVFRMNADGSDLEILGHNFRNNFEVAVDAYGRMWQSDNDDDGNQATRINYVMDYGNYGYHDELTGASWQTNRVGQDPAIPKRHWHLNDPGVVPNLLQTGSGSPTGILVYAGDQLPERLHGQMIHCEPGHNVVRSYPVTEKGAGFTAEMVPLMTSTDSWFRPSDVCTAPDGSLLVADWYDAGVGGHLMGDIQRGRIYRLYGEGHETYAVNPADLTTTAGAIAALGHPNQATRFLAYRTVQTAPDAEQKLLDLVQDDSAPSRLRARAAWALADRTQGADPLLDNLLATEDLLLHETAIRMTRQYPGDGNVTLLRAVRTGLASDVPALLREAALSLRFAEGAEADALWADLANKYDGQDRWYLEALGIGSDRFPADRFAAWIKTRPDLTDAAARQIVWRSRAPRALERYPELIATSRDSAELASLFRGLHFHDGRRAGKVIETALYTEDHPERDAVVRLALAATDKEALNSSPRIQARLQEVMPTLRGTDGWLMIVDNASLKGEIPLLLDQALASDENDFQDRAAKIIAKVGGIEALQSRFRAGDVEEKDAVVHLARHSQDWPAEQWLKALRKDEAQPLQIRRRATQSLANYWNGMPFLLDEVQSGDLPREEAEYIARVLSRCWRGEQRSAAIAWLAANRSSDAIDLDAVVAMNGDIAHGKEVFTDYCASCHQVGNEGVRYGPALTQIGDKLGRGALVSAIAYPSEGIGFGYEGVTFKTKDGKQHTGYVESQTENEITLRMMGGVSKVIAKRDVTERTELAESLMTAGLTEIMEARELADLLAYLETLRAEGELSR